MPVQALKSYLEWSVDRAL